jgi:type II secretory pathway component PulF
MASGVEIAINKFLFRMDAAGRRRLWLKLAKLISNGVPIMEALMSLYLRRVSMKSKSDPVALALDAWINQIRNGRRISDAIKGWVGSDEQMLLAAGEQSGSIDVALQSVTEIMVAKKNIRAAVIKGLSYPLALLAIAFTVLIMFSFKVIPEFSKIVPDDRWTGVARIMIDFANFSRDWYAVMIGVMIALMVLFALSLPRWTGGLRIWLDRFPPYSIYRIVYGSTWMISFSALVNAGVRLERALEQLSDSSSPWLKVRTKACLRGMRGGLNVGDALAKSGYGFPDIEIIDDLAVYSRVSGFDQALSTIGREWMTESVERIQGMMSVVFGVTILLVGGFIAFMVSGLVAMEMQISTLIQSR